ncbi:hypothetical protein PIB30_097019 [Stylosanthes scabra]|uniref:Uncharacterized protein n=1 Tax=Stylosanthes scabra TaxID=79078 RepID=A0ABU6ZUT8_9FABA|nr:hypothetical protein [Stylosanthes scabra]
MTIDQHLLLYVLSYMLLPRKRNHETVIEDDLPILWAMAKEKQLKCLTPLFIISASFSTFPIFMFDFASSSLGHVILWTRIFEALGFDLSWEEAVNPGKANAITRKNINQMRCNVDGQADKGDDQGDDAASRDAHMEDVPPPFEAGTSSQVPPEAGVPPPVQLDIAELIRQGFQDMRTPVSEGFTVLTDHMDSLDIHITNQDMEL